MGSLIGFRLEPRPAAPKKKLNMYFSIDSDPNPNIYFRIGSGSDL